MTGIVIAVIAPSGFAAARTVTRIASGRSVAVGGVAGPSVFASALGWGRSGCTWGLIQVVLGVISGMPLQAVAAGARSRIIPPVHTPRLHH